MSKKKAAKKMPESMRAVRWGIGILAVAIPLLPITVWLHSVYPIYNAMGMGWFTMLYLPARALGLVGFVLMVYQFVMSSRFRIMETAFTRPVMFQLHKNLGIIGFLIILLHGLFMLLFDIIVAGEIQLGAPRIAGIIALVLLIIAIVVAIWWKPMKLSRKQWMAIHRLTYLVLPIALYHAISIGTTLQTSQWIMGLFYVLGSVYVIVTVRRLHQAVKDFKKKRQPRPAAVDRG